MSCLQLLLTVTKVSVAIVLISVPKYERNMKIVIIIIILVAVRPKTKILNLICGFSLTQLWVLVNGNVFKKNVILLNLMCHFH